MNLKVEVYGVEKLKRFFSRGGRRMGSEVLQCPLCKEYPRHTYRSGLYWCDTQGCPLKRFKVTQRHWNQLVSAILRFGMDKYNELIMAVETKYPEETRHETALRYIREAEAR